MEQQSTAIRRVVRRCPFCGARIKIADQICPICGEALVRISQPKSASPPPPNTRPTALLPAPRALSIVRKQSTQLQEFHQPNGHPAQLQPRVQPFEMVYVQCPMCGGRAGIADSHCNVCGHKLDAVMPLGSSDKPQLRAPARPPRAMPPFRPAPAKPRGRPTMPRPVSEGHNAEVNPVLARTQTLGLIAATCMALLLLTVGAWLLQMNQSQASVGSPILPTTPTVHSIQTQPRHITTTPIPATSTAQPNSIAQATPRTSISPTTLPAQATAVRQKSMSGALTPQATSAIVEFYTQLKLQMPANNSRFDQNATEVVLQWNAEAPLKEGEFFVIHLHPQGSLDTPVFRTQSPQLKLQPAMLTVSANQAFTWWVHVQRLISVDKNTNAPLYQDISTQSDVRQFFWQIL